MLSTGFAKAIFAAAALLVAAATGIGAWESHAAAAMLDAGAQRSLATAVDYQFFHALGLLGVALLIGLRPDARLAKLGALILLGGIVLFCGGVYSSSLGGPGWIASLAPVGGMGLILGWLVVAVAALGR